MPHRISIRVSGQTGEADILTIQRFYPLNTRQTVAILIQDIVACSPIRFSVNTAAVMIQVTSPRCLNAVLFSSLVEQ